MVMMLSQKRFIPIVLVFIVMIALAAYGGLYVTERSTPIESTPPQSTFFVIKNSGSTNFPGYTLTVNGDGSGALIYDQCNTDLTRPQCHLQNKTYSTQTFKIDNLKEILSQIGSIQNIPKHLCPKSVSFGSSTTIEYNSQKSGDISCIDSSDPQIYQNLKMVVDALGSQTN